MRSSVLKAKALLGSLYVARLGELQLCLELRSTRRPETDALCCLWESMVSHLCLSVFFICGIIPRVAFLRQFFFEGLLILNVLALPVSKLFPLFSADTSYSRFPRNFGHSSVYPTLLSVIKILTIMCVIGA